MSGKNVTNEKKKQKNTNWKETQNIKKKMLKMQLMKAAR